MCQILKLVVTQLQWLMTNRPWPCEWPAATCRRRAWLVWVLFFLRGMGMWFLIRARSFHVLLPTHHDDAPCFLACHINRRRYLSIPIYISLHAVLKQPTRNKCPRKHLRRWTAIKSWANARRPFGCSELQQSCNSRRQTSANASRRSPGLYYRPHVLLSLLSWIRRCAIRSLSLILLPCTDKSFGHGDAAQRANV